MPLDPSTVGQAAGPYLHQYLWRDVACYALGIGAKRDELAYLYEGHAGGMRVYPTYALVAAYEPVAELLRRCGADLSTIVHAGQKLVAQGAIPPGGRLETVGRLAAIYDLRRFARIVIETTTTLGGRRLCETEWTIVARGAGGLGGARPPAKEPAVRAPAGREPDWVHEETTAPEQALLYRLSGDVNPLHADPEAARAAGFADGPILHGLCTFGYLVRAVVRRAAGGDAARLRALGAEFRRPAWPGDTLVTQAHVLEGGLLALQVAAKGRPGPVVANAWAKMG
ncbi:MAG: MaoC family dehydratase N-terminal domain-containing protein [Deltaproteobacteria bacterium]|nr:MaoC family dehydratase N-terminal domain-containing protein [Deltaproteobacteria bacterium]